MVSGDATLSQTYITTSIKRYEKIIHHINRISFRYVISRAGNAFAEANCQAHPKNEQILQADFQRALEKHGFAIKKFKTDTTARKCMAKAKAVKR